MSPPRSPNDILVEKLRIFPKVRVQNGLMRQADRPIALAMMYMEDGDRNRIIANLGSKKGNRVRDEIQYQQRLSVTYDQYRIAVSRVLDLLREARNSGPVKSYIRPNGSPKGSGRSRS